MLVMVVSYTGHSAFLLTQVKDLLASRVNHGDDRSVQVYQLHTRFQQ